MTATAPLPPGTDFADWLSPILVKELRQGLKSRVFVATFIIVQVVMILLVGFQLLTLAGGGGRGVMDTFDGFYWAFVWLPLLVMMPARGLTAVSEEVKANTLDLVQLTRLTAFRIVLGKWIALVSQTLLLVAAILPYAVLRYFFGEVDVVSDLKTIALLLMSSLWLTAGAIALSSVHLAVRIIVLVVLMPTLVTGIIPLMVMRATGGSSSFMGVFEWSWMLPVMTVIYIFLMLEIAASKIAPVSENHAAPKRLLALGMGVVAVVLAVFTDDEQTGMWMAASSLVWAWAMLEALSERTVMVPSLYAPFARKGFPGRFAGRVLYPGWASALLFCGIFLALMIAVLWVVNVKMNPTEWERIRWTMALILVIAFTSIVTPVVFLLLFPRVKQPIWLYILVQALFGLLFVIASIVGETPKFTETAAYRWLAPFPTSTLFALMNESNNEDLRRFCAMVTLPVCGIILVYLAVRAMMEFRVISRLERESLGKGG